MAFEQDANGRTTGQPLSAFDNSSGKLTTEKSRHRKLTLPIAKRKKRQFSLLADLKAGSVNLPLRPTWLLAFPFWAGRWCWQIST